MSLLFRLRENQKYEILGVVMFMLTMLVFLALVTDEDQRATRRSIEGLVEVPNLLGWPGAVFSGSLAILVGYAAHVIYFLTLVWGLLLFRHHPLKRIPTRLVGMLILVAAVAGLLHLNFYEQSTRSLPGGALGAFMAGRLFFPAFGYIGSNVIGITMAIIGVLLATEFMFIHAALGLRAVFVQFVGVNGLAAAALAHYARTWREAWKAQRNTKRRRRAQAPRDNAAGDHVQPEAPANAARPRPNLHIPQQAGADDNQALLWGQGESEPDVPFEAIPSLPDMDGPETAIMHAAVQLRDAPAAPPDTTDTPEAPQAVPVAVEEPAENNPAEDLPDRMVGLEEPDDSGLDGAAAPPRRRIRRKSTAQKVPDELPPDYEYPQVYAKPPLDMLDEPRRKVVSNLQEQLQKTSEILEKTLENFGIEAHVTDVTRGPTITRFELQPSPGIKVNKFLSLADDLALALKAHRVRVEAPIPGKGRVGIEVPNVQRDQVLVRELLESASFRRHKGMLPLALGKDIAGDVKLADLASMPHLLVAGATGSGKTVCVKALMASLLFSHTPEEVQLVLIDPKMVELSIFNDIPHLITPVVTDPKLAATALQWLIHEMDERYRLFAHLRCRNIEVYNESVDNGEIEVEGAEDNSSSVSLVRKLPYIVCIIDELADLMMLARAEVEDAIARLAQLARAVGIHLIIATQRPSVDVLTGVIKANFPARVSFQVSSRVDSRCILDEMGAERLIGSGDMLFLPPGHSKPIRVQGAFVSDREMNDLISYLKTQAPPQYKDEIENFGRKAESREDLLEEDDPLLDEAVRVVLETGQASISMVQRRLRVGYTRAARLIDMMEIKGIVGPHIGSKAREILVDTPPEENEE